MPGREGAMETVKNREARLLLALARIDLGEDHRIAIERILREGVDWERVVEMAGRNEVTPFLYHHLRSSASDGLVPAGLLASLERGYHANAYRNERLLEDLSRLLGALGEAGIDVMVLKGGAMLTRIYRGLPLRSMADIDLLVPAGEIGEKAKEVLFGMGYAHHPSHGSYWIGEDSRFRIELRTGIMAEQLRFFSHECGRLWERSEPAKIAGEEALVLCPEDFLLHLCVHAVYRHFFRLKFFIDISEFVRVFGDKLRWEELIRWGLELSDRKPHIHGPLPVPEAHGYLDSGVGHGGDEETESAGTHPPPRGHRPGRVAAAERA